MNIFFDKLFTHVCSGVYVSPNAIIAVRTSHKGRKWKVESVSAEIDQTDEGRAPDYENISMLRNNLYKITKSGVLSGTIQVAFDDRYVRFFVIPLNEKPEKNEVDNILRWHAKKVLNKPEKYVYTTQLVKTKNGFMVYGAAVNSDVIAAVNEILKNDQFSWYMADAAVSYVWNALEKQIRHEASVYISIARNGWTLIASDDNGFIEVIKPGRWSYDNDGKPQLRKGMIEVHRILTIFLDGRSRLEPGNIYIDTSSYPEVMGIAKELFGDVGGGYKTELMQQELFKNIPTEYSHEISVTFLASMLR